MHRLPRPLHKFKPSRSHLLIAYKLLIDLIFLGLAFFIIALVIDAILPGLISEKISFFRIIIFISVLILTSGLIARHSQIEITKRTAGSKTLAAIIFISALLAANSFLRLSLTSNAFFVILLAITAYYGYKSILEE